MQITVISAVKTPAVSKAGKPYTYVELAYKGSDGKIMGKKVMPFGEGKTVFDILENANQGESFEVTPVKNTAGFWDWVGITKSDGSAQVDSPQPTKTTPGGRVTGSNYETTEERARRQVYIVRQSSITAALSFLGGKSKSTDEVIQIAKEFEQYVFSNNESVAVANQVPSDTPD